MLQPRAHQGPSTLMRHSASFCRSSVVMTSICPTPETTSGGITEASAPASACAAIHMTRTAGASRSMSAAASARRATPPSASTTSPRDGSVPRLVAMSGEGLARHGEHAHELAPRRLRPREPAAHRLPGHVHAAALAASQDHADRRPDAPQVAREEDRQHEPHRVARGALKAQRVDHRRPVFIAPRLAGPVVVHVHPPHPTRRAAARPHEIGVGHGAFLLLEREDVGGQERPAPLSGRAAAIEACWR